MGIDRESAVTTLIGNTKLLKPNPNSPRSSIFTKSSPMIRRSSQNKSRGESALINRLGGNSECYLSKTSPRDYTGETKQFTTISQIANTSCTPVRLIHLSTLSHVKTHRTGLVLSFEVGSHWQGRIPACRYRLNTEYNIELSASFITSLNKRHKVCFDFAYLE